MEIAWVRIKEALYNMAEKSGAPIEYAKGGLVSMVATFMAFGWEMREIWMSLVPHMPDDLRVKTIPASWVGEGLTVWDINFKEEYSKDVVHFEDLVNEIPSRMLENRDPNILEDWSCRDVMLDKYLHICSIFQREHDTAWRLYREKQAEVDGVHKTMQGKSVVIEITPPKLVYSFAPFRKAGSQYIAEWAVSDMRKPQENSYNWHGQNTSRWLYAGCLLVQDGRVSIHT